MFKLPETDLKGKKKIKTKSYQRPSTMAAVSAIIGQAAKCPFLVDITNIQTVKAKGGGHYIPDSC